MATWSAKVSNKTTSETFLAGLGTMESAGAFSFLGMEKVPRLYAIERVPTPSLPRGDLNRRVVVTMWLPTRYAITSGTKL